MKSTHRERTEFPTNGSTGQREKDPAEPVCLITLGEKVKILSILKTYNKGR